MRIEIDDLECKRFGIVAARVTDPTAAPGEIDRDAAAAGVDLLTARIDVGDHSRVHAFEAAGYRLMDTLVYHASPLDNPPDGPPLASGVTLRRATASDRAAIAALARSAFADYIGHYHADPRLDSAAASAAYVEWAETGLATATDAAPVLVAHDKGRTAGFLTLRRNRPDEFEIVLNAVHPDNRGKGLYTALVAEALRVAQAAGAGRMIVSTQINNYAAQRAWARLGFAHYRSLYTFHKWFSE